MKTFVTTAPMEGVITIASGIPPHIHHARKLKLVMDNLLEIKHLLLSTEPEIISAVKSALEENVIQAGQVTYDWLKGLLDKSESKILALVQKGYDIRGNNAVGGTRREDDQIVTPWTWQSENIADKNLFSYKGQFVDVPKQFEFPRATIKEDLVFWFR